MPCWCVPIEGEAKHVVVAQRGPFGECVLDLMIVGQADAWRGAGGERRPSPKCCGAGSAQVPQILLHYGACVAKHRVSKFFIAQRVAVVACSGPSRCCTTDTPGCVQLGVVAAACAAVLLTVVYERASPDDIAFVTIGDWGCGPENCLVSPRQCFGRDYSQCAGRAYSVRSAGATECAQGRPGRWREAARGCHSDG
jgi:hypothetical protein